MSIESPADLAGMEQVGRVVARTIAEMKAAVRVGMTTAELVAIAASTFKRFGARSAHHLIAIDLVATPQPMRNRDQRRTIDVERLVK